MEGKLYLTLGGDHPFVAHRVRNPSPIGIPLAIEPSALAIRLGGRTAGNPHERGNLSVDANGAYARVFYTDSMGMEESSLLALSDWNLGAAVPRGAYCQYDDWAIVFRDGDAELELYRRQPNS